MDIPRAGRRMTGPSPRRSRVRRPCEIRVMTLVRSVRPKCNFHLERPGPLAAPASQLPRRRSYSRRRGVHGAPAAPGRRAVSISPRTSASTSTGERRQLGGRRSRRRAAASRSASAASPTCSSPSRHAIRDGRQVRLVQPLTRGIADTAAASVRRASHSPRRSGRTAPGPPSASRAAPRACDAARRGRG